MIRKPDGENQLRSIGITEPPGAAAMLSSVTPCPTATAEQIAPETLPKRDEQSSASCPASSIVGKSVAVAGLGSATYGAGAARVTLPGTVYLTGPYHGAPFGLLDVTETKGHTGPFELGNIGVMSRILVDENTAQATVISNPLPQFVEGVPASISEIMVDVDRPGFTFNPTNCSPLEVTGDLTGWNPNGVAEGSFAVHSPFHVSNCASLPFKPKLSLELEPDVSRVDGTGLDVKVTAAKGEANIHKTKLVFPTSIPSRLTTIQKACDDHIFNVNPANCPEGSVIGTAIAKTPVLKSPLVGPAYLVSHANASFPDAEFVLQGEGIKLVLDGKTDIKKGITSSSFESVPDAPVETLRSQTAARPALRLQRLRRTVRHAAEPADRIRRAERRHDQPDDESEARRVDQHGCQRGVLQQSHEETRNGTSEAPEEVQEAEEPRQARQVRSDGPQAGQSGRDLQEEGQEAQVQDEQLHREGSQDLRVEAEIGLLALSPAPTRAGAQSGWFSSERQR